MSCQCNHKRKQEQLPSKYMHQITANHATIICMAIFMVLVRFNYESKYSRVIVGILRLNNFLG